MQILKIISRNRRDFWADFQCEHCGYIEKNKSGYDDSFFHNKVIPTMKCSKCGKTSKEDYKPMMPKYDDNAQL